MDEFTTGAFARVTGLTRKALRLYDELGLLQPARTDPATGYRYYAPAQLELARRIAWLRRVGMPLARIRASAHRPAGELAAVVRDWWSGEEVAGVQRRVLVAALVEALHEEDDMPTTSEQPTTLRLRCAAATARGPVRERQQDGAAGDEWFAAVADGFGPHGDAVSARVLEAVAGTRDGDPGDVLGALDEVVRTVQEGGDGARAAGASAEPAPSVSGSTVTALVLTGADRLALVHVGDSRAWLLRDGRLSRLTHDHTLVRSMVEAGTLSEAEAASPAAGDPAAGPRPRTGRARPRPADGAGGRPLPARHRRPARRRRGGGGGVRAHRGAGAGRRDAGTDRPGAGGRGAGQRRRRRRRRQPLTRPSRPAPRPPRSYPAHRSAGAGSGGRRGDLRKSSVKVPGGRSGRARSATSPRWSLNGVSGPPVKASSQASTRSVGP